MPAGDRPLLVLGALGAGALLVLASRRQGAPAAAAPAATPAPAPAATPTPAAAAPAVRDLGASVLIPGGPYMIRVMLPDGTYSPAFGGTGGQYMGLMDGLSLSRANLRAVEAQVGGVWTPVWRA